MRTLFVLRIETTAGEPWYSIHWTRVEADLALQAWVKKEWFVGDGPFPEDPREGVERYFACNGGWEIDSVVLAPEFVHHFDTTCPACGADLTKGGAIDLSFFAAGTQLDARSNTTSNGTLVDVDGLAGSGYLSDAVCHNCAHRLEHLPNPPRSV
jgi:hypothetical protein